MAVLVAAPFFRLALFDLVQEAGGQGWQLAGVQFLSAGLQSAGLHDLVSLAGVATVWLASAPATQSNVCTFALVDVAVDAAWLQEVVLVEVVVALAAQQDCACNEPQNRLKVRIATEANNSFMIVEFSDCTLGAAELPVVVFCRHKVGANGLLMLPSAC